MNKKNLTDYYPVYKELDGTPAMFNAEDLIDRAEQRGLNTFQIAILLVKNAFEGHIFFTYQIRPDQLFRDGTILLKEKPVLLMQNFYEQFETYFPGFLQVETNIKALQNDNEPDKINFGLAIRFIVINHLIRYPVSIFSSFNNEMLKKLSISNLKAIDQNFRLAVLGERFLGEFAVIEKTNELYFEKFKELGQQLRIREEVLIHYQRKLMLAPNVKSEHELEDLLYKNLVEEKLKCTSQHNIDLKQFTSLKGESLSAQEVFKGKIKKLYRLISINCAEVHTSTDNEDRFCELNQIFQEASLINNLPALQISDTFLQYLQMVSLLAQVLAYRKSEGFLVSIAFPALIGEQKEIIISTDDLKLLEKNLEDKLIGVRIKFFTEYKIRFVLDDEFTEMHQHFLKQQIEYINNQILQIQNEIKEVLKVKSEIENQKLEE